MKIGGSVVSFKLCFAPSAGGCKKKKKKKIQVTCVFNGRQIPGLCDLYGLWIVLPDGEQYYLHDLAHISKVGSVLRGS